jgi:hypothetical protein
MISYDETADQAKQKLIRLHVYSDEPWLEMRFRVGKRLCSIALAVPPPPDTTIGHHPEITFTPAMPKRRLNKKEARQFAAGVADFLYEARQQVGHGFFVVLP